jgi:hypothetical protein
VGATVSASRPIAKAGTGIGWLGPMASEGCAVGRKDSRPIAKPELVYEMPERAPFAVGQPARPRAGRVFEGRSIVPLFSSFDDLEDDRRIHAGTKLSRGSAIVGTIEAAKRYVSLSTSRRSDCFLIEFGWTVPAFGAERGTAFEAVQFSFVGVKNPGTAKWPCDRPHPAAPYPVFELLHWDFESRRQGIRRPLRWLEIGSVSAPHAGVAPA